MRRPLPLVLSALTALVAALAGASVATASGHAAITITKNSDFQSCACVTSGSGSASSPYVIGPWAISAPSGGSTGWAVKVDNSNGGVTAFFTVTGISANYNDTVPTDPIIWLVGVHQATTVSSISANGDGTGLELDASSNITVDNMNFNKMTGHAAFFNGASNINMSNSKWKATQDGVAPHQADGLYALNSSYLNIGGVPACPKSTACNTFDYDTGWGIYLQNSTHVNIEHASANADDTGGYIFDNSSFVDLGNSTGEASGAICITLNGQKVFTGYRSDMQGGLFLINGSSNNTIHDDAFAADTGVSIGNGGNGFFINPCTNQNEPFTAEARAGSGNSFVNDCYSSNTFGLPPNPCK